MLFDLLLVQGFPPLGNVKPGGRPNFTCCVSHDFGAQLLRAHYVTDHGRS